MAGLVGELADKLGDMRNICDLFRIMAFHHNTIFSTIDRIVHLVHR